MSDYKKGLFATTCALLFAAALGYRHFRDNSHDEMANQLRMQLANKVCLAHAGAAHLNDPEIAIDTIFTIGNKGEREDDTIAIAVRMRNIGQHSLFVSCFGVKLLTLSGGVQYWNTLGPYLSSVVSRDGLLTCVFPPTITYADARGLILRPKRTAVVQILVAKSTLASLLEMSPTKTIEYSIPVFSDDCRVITANTECSQFESDSTWTLHLISDSLWKVNEQVTPDRITTLRVSVANGEYNHIVTRPRVVKIVSVPIQEHLHKPFIKR